MHLYLLVVWLPKHQHSQEERPQGTWCVVGMGVLRGGRGYNERSAMYPEGVGGWVDTKTITCTARMNSHFTNNRCSNSQTPVHPLTPKPLLHPMIPAATNSHSHWGSRPQPVHLYYFMPCLCPHITLP